MESRNVFKSMLQDIYIYGHSNAYQYIKYLIAHSPIFMVIKDILFIKEEILNL